MRQSVYSAYYCPPFMEVGPYCPSDLKNFANYWSSALILIFFSRSLEQFFLTVDRSNYGNKILYLRPYVIPVKN